MTPISTKAAISITRPEASVPPVDPAGAATSAEVAGELADGAVEVVAVVGVVVAGRVVGEVALGMVAAALSVILVITLALQVSTAPPGFPVPLHWVTVIGIARLTLDCGSTEQCTLPPPPLPEPLHWVTVVPVAVDGEQSSTPPPPVPEPTHWLTVGAARGCATDVPRPMLLTTFTEQLIAWLASLSEPLHCRMTVTRLTESVMNVPFGVEQGPSVHRRVTVVLERVDVPLTVLTTVTVHSSAVVAPATPGTWTLHWSTIMVEACAVVGRATPASENPAVSMIRAVTRMRQVARQTEV